MQINLIQKTLHFKKPARTSRGAYSEHDMIIVTVSDDKGTIMGMGECAPLPDLSYDRKAYRSLSEVARLINEAFDSDDYTEYLRPYPALLFALESAMYDYQHKGGKKPVLYDTPFARGEVGIPINGLIWMSDYEDMLHQAEKKIEQGFNCIKIKIGAIAWDEEIGLIRLLRERFSKDTLQLRVDANGSFTSAEALDKLSELAKYHIHSIEQPIPAHSGAHDVAEVYDAMAELCQKSPLPIALDEELIGVNSLADKRLLLDTVKPHFIVVKPTLHGGISGAIEWISEAHKRNIGSWITSALESNIGLRNVALLSALVYGPENTFPQGLGTGLLFTDNIDMDIEIRGDKIWMTP